jgi:flagellar basal-body rod modification protein FlgD
MNIQGFTPEITAPVQGHSASSPTAAGSSSSTSSSNSSTSAASLQNTFLNLLVTELQNQDPTSPVDPTAMVGQMVSLNQLDQLVNINSTLSGLVPSSSSTSGSSTSTGSPLVASATGSGSPATSSPRLATPAASSQQVPAFTGATDPSAIMNLYGSMASPAATLSSALTGGI